MNDFITYLFLFNVFGSLALMFAALERTVSLWLALIVSVIFSPVIGFLFVLCFPTKIDEDTKLYLKTILDRIDKRNDAEKQKIEK